MTTETKAPKKAKPTIRERANDRVCPECGGAVVRRSAKGPMPTFCSPECKKTRSNRRLVRGSAVIEFLQAWRIDRGSGEIAQAAFAQLCAIADQFNSEDNQAGRPRADLMAAKILADGTIFADRQRQVALARGLAMNAARDANAAAPQADNTPKFEW
jgi:hypothetical protein